MNRRIPYLPVAALVLMVAFLAQTFSRNVAMADYYLNTARYALRCENKARPMMHCNGHCQMMKKMQQEEKQNQGNPERRTDGNSEVTLSSKSFFANINVTILFTDQPKKLPMLMLGKPVDRAGTIFHPPAA